MEYELTLVSVSELAKDVKCFRLTRPKNLSYQAGHYFILKLDNTLMKPFSFSSSPTEEGYIEFTTRISDSDYKKALNSLSVGGKVTLSGPMGSFAYNPSFKKLAFLAGGIGITPFRSMCKYLTDTKADCDVVLIWGNRTEEDIIFRKDFEEMMTSNPKLKVVHVLSQPSKEWPGLKGRINTETILAKTPDYKDRTFYLCGPPKMVEAMEEMLAGLGVKTDNIVVERFRGY
ncbi:MAG: FAD-dependent oxidoreductase [Candidatus Altiarchaeota archaeon]